LTRWFKIFFLFISLTLFGFMESHAQKQFNVMDWKTDVTLNTWLVQQMQQQYQERQIKYSRATRDAASAKKYIETVRGAYRNIVGELPRRTSLNPKITGTIKGEGYSIEKLVYESFPSHHVTSSLYIPSGKGPFPAILFLCGHEDISKATESYQRTAILLAKNGFVVLVIDPISQSERHQLTGENGKPLTRGGTTEHTILNAGANLLGTSIPVYQLWDNMRGIDYLETRKEVDRNRMGVAGNSGGAIQAIYLAGYDKRIKASAICSFLMNRERALEMTGPSDGCSHMPGEGGAGLEMNDILLSATPNPLLILAGRYDFIDYPGTVVAFKEIRSIYNALGKSSRVSMLTVDDGHGISQPKREATVDFFNKWLRNSITKVKEGPVQVLTDKELFSTTSGQVNTAFSSEINISDKNLLSYYSFQNSRALFINSDAAKQKQIIQKALAYSSKGAVTSEFKEAINSGGINIEKFILRKENEVPLPLLLIKPPSEPSSVVVWFADEGKNKIADSISLIRTYLDRNTAIVLADLRGMGETEDRSDMNDPKYFNKEYRSAMLSIHIGKPLLSQRTKDVEMVLTFIEEKLGIKPLTIHASGRAALPALHATILNNSKGELHLYKMITTWKTILADPLQKHVYGEVIPGVLKHYDIPDLLKVQGQSKIFIH
jgi:hypothetical protein